MAAVVHCDGHHRASGDRKAKDGGVAHAIACPKGGPQDVAHEFSMPIPWISENTICNFAD
jgi:hypothetical protein